MRTDVYISGWVTALIQGLAWLLLRRPSRPAPRVDAPAATGTGGPKPGTAVVPSRPELPPAKSPPSSDTGPIIFVPLDLSMGLPRHSDPPSPSVPAPSPSPPLPPPPTAPGAGPDAPVGPSAPANSEWRSEDVLDRAAGEKVDRTPEVDQWQRESGPSPWWSTSSDANSSNDDWDIGGDDGD